MAKSASIALAATLSAIAVSASAQAPRDYISIVGSSTVYPFTTVVAEQFGKSTSFKTPKIESTGTGGGFKLFCAGVGVQHADITNASRAIKKSEIETCAKNGVTEIIEVKVGYDGLTIAHANSAPDFGLTRKQVWMALAKEVPDASGKWVANPYTNWKQIDSKLPDAKIEVLGPPPTSGTRDAFVELVLDEGCKDAVKGMDSKEAKAKCQTVREDGGYVEAGENDNLIVQKLAVNPTAVGIFGFSFLDQNTDKLKGVPVEGVTPRFESIADGSYPVSRPLFFYVKKAHVGVIPGMKEFLAEFTSDRAWGNEGYLSDRGLIPLPKAERAKVGKAVANLEPMGASM